MMMMMLLLQLLLCVIELNRASDGRRTRRNIHPRRTRTPLSHAKETAKVLGEGTYRVAFLWTRTSPSRTANSSPYSSSCPSFALLLRWHLPLYRHRALYPRLDDFAWRFIRQAGGGWQSWGRLGRLLCTTVLCVDTLIARRRRRHVEKLPSAAARPIAANCRALSSPSCICGGGSLR